MLVDTGATASRRSRATADTPSFLISILWAAMTLASAIEPTVVLEVVETERLCALLRAALMSGAKQSRSTARISNTSWSSGFRLTLTSSSVKVSTAVSAMLVDMLNGSLVRFSAMVRAT